jgi:hypothetical protein
LLDGHEFTGDLGGQNPDAKAMDEHNNQLGIDLKSMGSDSIDFDLAEYPAG